MTPAAWNYGFKNGKVLESLVGLEEFPGMAWTYLYLLSDKDLLEHGGNCSGSWLTEKGDEVLDALLQFNTSDVIDYEPGVLDAEVVG